MCSSVSLVYVHIDVHDREVKQMKESMVPAPKGKKAVAGVEKKVIKVEKIKAKIDAPLVCWQCMHLARGGKGGHKHTFGKTAWKR